jgi:hypothetical protein
MNTDWLAFVVYGVAIGMSVIATLVAADDKHPHLARRSLWPLLTVVLLVLVTLKVLDVQSTLVGEGRDIARLLGWYGERRLAQGAAIVLLAGVSFVFYRLAASGVDEVDYALPLAAIFALCAFAAIRSVSLHQVDSLLYRTDLAGMQTHRLIEDGLTFVVAASAAASIAKRHAGRRADGAQEN